MPAFHVTERRYIFIYRWNMRRNADTLKRLQETERKLKEQQTKAYISMDISNGEREKGNQVCNC